MSSRAGALMISLMLPMGPSVSVVPWRVLYQSSQSASKSCGAGPHPPNARICSVKNINVLWNTAHLLVFVLSAGCMTRGSSTHRHR